MRPHVQQALMRPVLRGVDVSSPLPCAAVQSMSARHGAPSTGCRFGIDTGRTLAAGCVPGISQALPDVAKRLI
jgi:hypothetical protein